MKHLAMLSLLTIFAFWLKSVRIQSGWQHSGLMTFSLGFVLLAAYAGAHILKFAKLPLISGYILAGIVAGPYVAGFLSHYMVEQLRLVDDLALSFIALTAGGTLHLQFMKKRRRAIALNITLLTTVVFTLVFMSVKLIGDSFGTDLNLSSSQVMALACLLGVIAVARSPSSAVAIISECRASGVFTSTVLGVTVTMDVLIITLFTLALTATKIILFSGGAVDYAVFAALFAEIIGSLLLGAILGKGITFYIDKAGHDLALFLLFFAFGVTKASLWLNLYMEANYSVYLHVKPLLICMSAGFTIRNFGSAGHAFLEGLDRVSLPIYVLFFSLAGASLDLDALRVTWPIALSLAGVRAAGIFIATWFAGKLNGDPEVHNRVAWMAYLTQAGVAIGLAQLAQQQFPEIGTFLTTVVLAVITVNQVVGPVTFKAALKAVGEIKGG